MKTYARIVDGVVVEVITPITDESGDEVPIGNRFTAAFALELVDITSVSPQPAQWWTATQTNGTWAFGSPVSSEAP